MDEIQIRAALPEEYEDTGSLTQRANAEYARPGDPLWDKYFGDLADVGGRHAAHHRADGGRAAYLPIAGLPA